MITKPYKECNKGQIVQVFGVNPQSYQPQGHTGVDFGCSYGTYLVAPEVCDVANIISSQAQLNTDTAPLDRGYGILLRSVNDPSIMYLYWHCLPVFPVEIGQRVMQGQVVGQMGNSGFCIVRGQVVPLDIRTIPPYSGTHLHAERRVYKPDGTFEYTDILKYIDWSIPIQYDIITVWKTILNKILNILK